MKASKLSKFTLYLEYDMTLSEVKKAIKRRKV